MFERAPCRSWALQAAPGDQSPWFALADADADPDLAVVAVTGCTGCDWRLECVERLIEVTHSQGRTASGIWCGIQMGLPHHQGRRRAQGPDWRTEVPIWKVPTMRNMVRLRERIRNEQRVAV